MFPLGFTPYIVGGFVIGVAVAFVYVLTGLHATQSSVFTTTWSYLSRLPYFQRKSHIEERGWRLWFAAGVASGAFIYAVFVGGFFVSSVALWRIILGGFLVGFGTRLSGGCTSGHGISGLASLSTSSLYAVLTFMGVAIVVANALALLGVA